MKRTLPPLLIAVIVVAAGPAAVGAADDPVLEVTFEGDNTVAVTLSAVPNGLSGFEMGFTARDGATIERIEFGDGFGAIADFDISDDGTSAQVKSSDASGSYDGDETDVTLLRIHLSGVSTDSPPLAVSMQELQDNDGNEMDATVQIGDQAGGGIGETTKTTTVTATETTTVTETTNPPATTDESTQTATATETTDEGDSTADATAASTLETTEASDDADGRSGGADETPVSGPGFGGAIALAALAAAGLLAGRLRQY